MASALEEHMIPDGFKSLILDLAGDLYNTFPEFAHLFNDDTQSNVGHFYLNRETACPKRMLDEYTHCSNTYSEHFFDILYENNELFSKSPKPLYFLKGVDFRDLWNVEDLSEQTRKTLWKYIQLVLFKVVENTDKASDFGDSSAFFEAIDDEALKAKMSETLDDIKHVFETMEQQTKEGDDNADNSSQNHHNFTESMPSMDALHEHLSGLFKGKIGRLAEEIMEETKEEWANDFGIDLEENESSDDEDERAHDHDHQRKQKKEVKTINDVFSKLLKDPLKLVNLIKKIGTKLEDKIKSGEVKESELLEETAEMMRNIKNTPGLKDMEKIFKTFAANNKGGDGDKVSQGMANMASMFSGKKQMNAMQSQLSKNIRESKQRERMLKKLEERRKQRENK